MHPRYNPENDGKPQHKDCRGCESLFVIHLYCYIVRRKAACGEGILVSRPEHPARMSDSPRVGNENPEAGSDEQARETEDAGAALMAWEQDEGNAESTTPGSRERGIGEMALDLEPHD